MIVTICSEKGGVGKSMIASHTAARLAQTGRPTLLIDADPQGSSARWAAQRAEHRPQAPQVAYSRVSGSVIGEVKAQARSYQHIVIDCGGADSEALRSSLLVAHRAIVPTQVSRRDMATVAHMAGLIEQANERRSTPLVARVVFNRCSPLPSFWTRIDEARDALQGRGLEVTEAVLRHRVAYDDSEYQGGTVYEHDDAKAREEMETVLKMLLRKHGTTEAAT